MLTRLAIWYLRKRKVSAVLGYKVTNGTMMALNDKAFLYDNQLNNVDYWNSNGKKIVVPEGKFHIQN